MSELGEHWVATRKTQQIELIVSDDVHNWRSTTAACDQHDTTVGGGGEGGRNGYIGL
jgi:hypothetical protein